MSERSRPNDAAADVFPPQPEHQISQISQISPTSLRPTAPASPASAPPRSPDASAAPALGSSAPVPVPIPVPVPGPVPVSVSVSVNPGPQRSHRQAAAPSPLQTSTTFASSAPRSPPSSSSTQRSSRTTLSSATLPPPPASSQTYNQPPERPPLSPKERLDDLLASEKSFYKPSHPLPSPVTASGATSPRNPRSLQHTHDIPRSVSESIIITSKGPFNSHILPRHPMAATAPAHRAMGSDGGRMPPPRTSSIDSAISNISGSSLKLSNDMQAPDVANLIQTAGSPEAVIHYLLKEKASQSTQNAQLWRLVDKQRAMILGLNKDLERALKDKERYRTKLKESLAQLSNPSPVDSTQGMHLETETVSSKNRSLEIQIPPAESNVGTIVSAGLRGGNHLDELQHSPIDVSLAPYPITPPSFQTSHVDKTVLPNMTEAEHTMPSPTKHAFQQYDSDAPAPGFEAGQQQRKAAETSREMPYNANVPPSRTLPAGPPPSASLPKAPSPSALSLPTPTLSITGTTPDPDRGSPKFSPLRKAPPAPLNLQTKNEPSSHLRQVARVGDESDSDYDDVLEANDIPAFTERGRRKTREEDDKDREFAVQKEAELRSLSKKSKSGGTTPTDKGVLSHPENASPLFFTQTEQTASLAGMLSASQISAPLRSPGLPSNPRPSGSTSPFGQHKTVTSPALQSPPLSPRSMTAFPGSVPLSPRAPRHPIPLPPNTPLSMASPGLPVPRPDQNHLPSPKPLTVKKNEPSIAESTTTVTPSVRSFTDGDMVYTGFLTDEYPDMILPPNALPSIYVKVASSRLKPSRQSRMFPANMDSDPVFTLAVFSRSDKTELWRCEKDSASLANIDQLLRSNPAFNSRLPEKSLFNGHAPAKVDARRVALDQYLDDILNIPLDTEDALEICKYLSSNAVEAHAEDGPTNVDTSEMASVKTGPGGRPLKSGYLTKRGKNFGGWKARFFVLDGPIFKYYESPGGPHLGAIKLQKAQIGKQQQQSDSTQSPRGETDDVDNQYRHAFLILEPKRKDSSSLVRHVLCAESDQERDQWVEALLKYVDFLDPDDEEKESEKKDNKASARKDNNRSSPDISGPSKKKSPALGKSPSMPVSNDQLQAVSYEAAKQGNAPRGLRKKGSTSGTPSPPTDNLYDRAPLPQSQSMKSISAPKNAQVIQDTGSWGNKQSMLAPSQSREDIRQKKRSFFGFGAKPRVSSDSQDTTNRDSTLSLSQLAQDQHGPIRQVFGAPLSEAVKYNHPADVKVNLPAVVYRCMMYLDAKNAAGEEGIFRLSGSNVVIRALRDRFNTEGDLDLVTDEQYYDIHAVASLLKLYLRELPSTILTRELHLDFLAVTELRDVNEKIRALNGLVRKLPSANNTLLKYLASFLINIINHADTNKMTVRNVGIVFSPTLNIPAPVFALFLQQYEGIFGEPNEDERQRDETADSVSNQQELRSATSQKFSQDLQTPSYHAAPPQGLPLPQHYQRPRQGSDSSFLPTPSQAPYEQFGTMAGPEYGSRHPTLAGPAYDQFGGGSPAYSQAKSKRRESSMFNVAPPQRKPDSRDYY